MQELVNVIKAGRVVNPTSFQPQLQVLLNLNLEALTDTSVLYADAYIERMLVKELVAQIQAKLDAEKNSTREILLVPEALVGKITPVSDSIALVVNQDYIKLHQALFPVLYGGLEMKTHEVNVGMDNTRFSLLQSDEKFLNEFMQKIQRWMGSRGMQYFYYATVLRRVDNNLDNAYTVLVRGK